ncbi:hypothetical protein QCA50_003610 [Cerrena zonata]|uniref:Protein-S-isoprenylcysteine O-methyltransferase n=1 Tax=Cerrena zonata TaxID=2478898 RepID=A0AAW0GQB9_9APHY
MLKAARTSMFPSVYLKLLLHFLIVFFNWRAWTSPHTASPTERRSYVAKPKTRDYLPNFISWYVPILMTTLNTVSVIELYLLLCTIFPNITNTTAFSLLSVTSSTLIRLTHVPVSFALGSFLLFTGASIRAFCYYLLGKQFTFELALRKNHKLCTSGPYAFVRHPSYTGAVLGLFGVSLCMFGPGSWWAECHIGDMVLGKALALHWTMLMGLMLGLVFTRVGKEDLVLKEAFGSEWDEWARKTPYGIIPFVY